MVWGLPVLSGVGVDQNYIFFFFLLSQYEGRDGSGQQVSMDKGLEFYSMVYERDETLYS